MSDDLDQIRITREEALEIELLAERTQHAQTKLELAQERFSEAYKRLEAKYEENGKYKIVPPIDTTRRVITRVLNLVSRPVNRDGSSDLVGVVDSAGGTLGSPVPECNDAISKIDDGRVPDVPG